MSSLLGKRGRTARICRAFLHIPHEFVSPSRILCDTRDVEDSIKQKPTNTRESHIVKAYAFASDHQQKLCSELKRRDNATELDAYDLRRLFERRIVDRLH